MVCVKHIRSLAQTHFTFDTNTYPITSTPILSYKQSDESVKGVGWNELEKHGENTDDKG